MAQEYVYDAWERMTAALHHFAVTTGQLAAGNAALEPGAIDNTRHAVSCFPLASCSCSKATSIPLQPEQRAAGIIYGLPHAMQQHRLATNDSSRVQQQTEGLRR